MQETHCHSQLSLFEVGRQEVVVDFSGGDIVTDAGLLPLRELDLQLGVLAEAARRMPDPRSQLFITHSTERIVTQSVYQILAGYPDGNDADRLRHDPLFKTIAEIDPRLDIPLASGSTLNRFQHAFTRRDADVPIEERDVIHEVQQAQIERIKALNEFFIDIFVRTRREVPSRIVIDLDPTDVPTHGDQQLQLFHGYYKQHQYFPMLIFEGETGLPLGAWLQPGTTVPSSDSVNMLRRIVERLRKHWPDVVIQVRGDCGLASPEMYEYCEDESLEYAFGYATNPVLKRRVAELELADEARLLAVIAGRRSFQLFHSFDDYRATSWSKVDEARRIVTKVELTATGGLNVRHVVTNMSGPAADVYKDFYVKRGNVPERPIRELKRDLEMTKLSSHRFLANSHKMMMHLLAYLLHALFREANAETEALQSSEAASTRAKLFKAGAIVKGTHRRIWVKIASHWPGAALFREAVAAVKSFVKTIRDCWAEQGLFLDPNGHDPRRRAWIRFAPLPPK